MKIGKIELPDKCPENCSLKNDIMLYGQDALCLRCPVLNCRGEDPLLFPEDYREDWAEAWDIWFKGGMKGFPKLYL
ncbi:MAG: hypothetical protein WC503_01035 [Candidatus Shapirobacteria bacterium]